MEYNQKQDRSQNSFNNHTNNKADNAGFTVKPLKQKKKTLKEFKQETKVRWIKFKLSVKNFVRTSKKVFRFIMVIYVIASAIITANVLIEATDSFFMMLDAYGRVESRTENIKKEEIEKEFQGVSDAKSVSGIKAAQAATPALAVKTTAVSEVSTVRKVSAYNLVPEQTDSSPCIGAANQNLCYLMRVKKMNVCAANRYEFGTILKIPGYLGSQKDGNDTCVVLDVLHEDYAERIDISMDQDLVRADNFGVQPINITVVGYMKNWSKLAPAKIFTEPSR